MRLLWRVLVVVAMFAVIGYATMRVLTAHAVAQGSAEVNVRLGAAMGGLFAGGAAAAFVALALLVRGRRTTRSAEANPD